MSFDFKFIEHTADAAFQAEADSLEELFTACAYGWKETVIEQTDFKTDSEKNIELIESSIEELLAAFLDELNFLLNTKKWLPVEVKNISLNQNDDWKLSAIVSGTNFDSSNHTLKSEIKAVTFHQMDVKFINNKFTTRVVFDI